MTAQFKSILLTRKQDEWTAKLLPAYGDLRTKLAGVETLAILVIRDVCFPRAVDCGQYDFHADARILRLTASRHGQDDSTSGFMIGIERIEQDALRHTSFDILCKMAWSSALGHVVDRTGGGSYLSEAGCGVHKDSTKDHEVVLEMWGGHVCSLPAEDQGEVISLLQKMAGPLGARVLCPDAHVSLGVRPLRDVMVAHLKVWQHFSIDDELLGRYGTAVLIS
jgi:hypothetical protein